MSDTIVHLRALLDPEVPVCRGELSENDELVSGREGGSNCPDCRDVLNGKWITSVRRTRR